MSKWKTTEARTSCVLDLCFQLYSSLLPLIILSCIVELQFGLGLCYPWCNTKTQETFFCFGCIRHDPWTLAAAWSLANSLDKSTPEPKVLDFWLPSTTTVYNDELWWNQIRLRTDHLSFLNSEIAALWPSKRVPQQFIKHVRSMRLNTSNSLNSL